MIVLPQDQIDKMKEIMDYLFKYQALTTVGEVKKRFGLTSEEYDMIYDLCMPLIRESGVKKYWAIKYQSFVQELKRLIKNRKNLTSNQFYSEFRKIVYAKSNGEPLMMDAAGVENES